MNKPYMVDMSNLIERLKRDVEYAEANEWDMDSVSWGYEEGTLISYNEAKAIIRHSEQTRWIPVEESAVSKELLPDVDYWKQRCLLAENCLQKSPCDPDITREQIEAHEDYNKFLAWAGLR